VRAWAPFLQWAGPHAQQLAQALQRLPEQPAQQQGPSLDGGPRVLVDSLASEVLHLSPDVAAALRQSFTPERAGAEVVALIPRTGVSTEDLLITLNMLVEDDTVGPPGGVRESDAGADEPAGGFAHLHGVPLALVEKLQEGLDALVESVGPEGEDGVVDAAALTRVLAQTIPLLSWASLLTKLAREVELKEMGGNVASSSSSSSAAAAAPAAAAAASAAPAAAARKPAASGGSKGGSNGGGGSGFGGGGGLDLSISGFSIKPPGAAAKAAGKK
jgi:ribosomal protein L12E/L44/L45/RPP1/RPP2